MAKKTTSVQIKGLREIRDNLYRLPKAVREGVVYGILEEHAKPIAEAAAGMAPVRTGRLSDSIRVSRTADGYKRERGVFSVFIGPGPEMSPRGFWQEFGTINHGPQPFMRPAWDGASGELAQSIADAFWQEIEKELGLT